MVFQIIISLHHAVINIQVVSVKYLKVTACTSTLEKCQIWNFLVNLVLQVSLLWLTGKMDAFKQQIPVHCSWKVLVPFGIHLTLQSLIKLIGDCLLFRIPLENFLLILTNVNEEL